MSDLTPRQAEVAIQDLTISLEKARELIQKQNYALKILSAIPRPCAVVLRHTQGGKTAFIHFDNKVMEVGVDPEVSNKLRDGDTVSLSNETMSIICKSSYPIQGPILLVEEVIDNNNCVVEWGGSARLVKPGHFKGGISKGDRVTVDESCSIVMSNFGKIDGSYSIQKSTGITWNQIGGLEDAKREIIDAIISPFKQPDLYKFYGKKPCRGILLFGPPRCGKTLIVKATTTAVSEAFGASSISSGFIYIKGPEILSKYIGVAEERISQLFRRTREHKAKHGFPAVLFIDEADAILSKRGTGISSDVNNTIVPAFLSEMDGLEDTGAVIILATNRSDILDPAIVQEGRIDKKIHIGRPDEKSTVDIFKVHLKDVPIGSQSNAEQIVNTGTKEIFCPNKKLYKVELRSKEVKYFTLGHLCSGGMIAGIVQQATSQAMRRNQEEKTDRQYWGVQCEDMVEAVRSAFLQNYHIDHSDDLELFVDPFRKDVVRIEKVSA